MSFPAWAQEMARTYQGGAVNTFILYGNIHDVSAVEGDNGVRFVGLKDLLVQTMFPKREMIFTYDLASGIRIPPRPHSDPSKESTMQQVFEGYLQSQHSYDKLSAGRAAVGVDLASLPREPARALPLMERFLRSRLLDQPNYRAAILIDYAHFVAPASLGYNFTQDEAACLITLHKWSSDPAFTKADITIVLLVENLSDLHPLMVRSPHTTKIQIPLPEQHERLEYLKSLCSTEDCAKISSLSLDEISIHTAGLSRVNLEQVIATARLSSQQAPPGSETPRKLDLDHLFEAKKALIEKECFGLLEFLKPKRGLEAVSGHSAAKAWLLEDAKLLKEGKLDALPMGYLICGPVGTGKTYMMTCYAGTLGIPCVKLMNFRSQWQGVTEGNWEKIITTLKATGPVAVIIDEADAAVGDRDSSGDSGTSQRIFAMLANQMADTNYRGKIIWFLMTARPDLLPIDLKRQGRAEVHIPLFYPESDDEKRTYFAILAKKNGSVLSAQEVPDQAVKMRLSGADIEGLVVRAKRRALIGGSPVIRQQDLAQELESFIPPTKTEEVELQILAAVIECTHQDFLTGDLRKLDRAEAARRLAQLKLMF